MSNLVRFVQKLEDALFRRDSGKASGAAMTKFTVQLRRDELDGGWIAECVDLPGCVSDGDTVDEALQHLMEAITGVLSVRLQQHARQVTCELVEYEHQAQAGPRKVAISL
jgi:predicted RNase H-like HicB family nuclease